MQVPMKAFPEVYSLQVGYIDDRFGPLGLAGVVVLALTAILIISIVDFVDQLNQNRPAPAPIPALGLDAAASLMSLSSSSAQPSLMSSPSLRSHPFGNPALQRSS